MRINPYRYLARWSLETNGSKSGDGAASYYCGFCIPPLVLAVIFLFIGALQQDDYTHKIDPASWTAPLAIFLLVNAALGYLAFFIERREWVNAKTDSFGDIVASIQGVCRILIKDKTLNEGWRMRAEAIDRVTKICVARHKTYSKAGVDTRPLIQHVRRLDQAANILAQQQMIVDLAAHTTIIETEVDSLLRGYDEVLDAELAHHPVLMEASSG